jgi:hypothetical protein
MPTYIRKRLTTLGLCLIAGIGAVAALGFISDLVNHRKNGFVRLIPPHVLAMLNAKDIGYNSFYIVGTAANKVYLGNTMAPSKLLITDFALKDTQIATLTFPGKPTILQGANLVWADSPFIYLMEGRVPLLMRGSLSSLVIDQVKPSTYFMQALPVSPSSFVIRMYDRVQRQTVLARTTLDKPTAEEGARTLERQGDGIFSTDGMLNVDPASGRIIYMYFYRNQLPCFDTALNLLYTGRTIDTVSQAQLSVATIGADSSTTLSAPPHFVNYFSCIADNLLFVHSALMANNETESQFEQASAIDVYDVRDGRYRFSFYIPKLLDKKMKSFRIFGNRLFAIYDHYLVVYQVNFPRALTAWNFPKLIHRCHRICAASKGTATPGSQGRALAV